MNRFLKRAWAEIDLDALEHNYNEIKKLAKGKDILAVVKANAYGHDDKAVCLKLQELGVKYYGVSNLWEKSSAVTELPVLSSHSDIPMRIISMNFSNTG